MSVYIKVTGDLPGLAGPNMAVLRIRSHEVDRCLGLLSAWRTSLVSLIYAWCNGLLLTPEKETDTLPIKLK